MKKFGKIGLSALGAIVLTASATWAAPFTGAMQGVQSWSPIPGTNTSSIAFVLHGYTTAGGAMLCHGAGTSSSWVNSPTGACRATELQGRLVNTYYCQNEKDEDIFNARGETTSCTPFSCFDASYGAPQVGCSFTFTENGKVTGGSGAGAGARGSWTATGRGTYTQAAVTAAGAIFFTASLNLESEGDIELADGSVPSARAALEIPSSGTTVSGIGLISGWSCLGGELEVEFSDAAGVILTQRVLQGTERLDTEGVCEDIDNGFSSLINWARLGAGERTARLIRNGEEVAAATFRVTALAEEFVTGVEGLCTIPDFPDLGKNATFVWEQSQQGVVLESVH